MALIAGSVLSHRERRRIVGGQSARGAMMNSREGGSAVLPSTYFAPAGRATAAELAEQIALVAHSPLVTAVLAVHGSAMAVVNHQRQIVALNAACLAALGRHDAAEALGLRPGEAVGCVHAHEHTGGCGTSRSCSTCGAVIAILLAQREGRGVDRECSLRIAQPSGPVDLQLRVSTSPVKMAGGPFTVVLLQDVTAEKRHQVLERAFLHDLNNLLTALLGACEALEASSLEAWPPLLADVTMVSRLLAKEVAVQRAIVASDTSKVVPRWELVPLAQLVEALRALASHHPAAAGKTLQIPAFPQDASLETDRALAGRVLTNMVVNAFEATPAGGTVKVDVEVRGLGVRLGVWNAGEIPTGVVDRVFQRFFSTKEGEARGQGTYTMKLLGEGPLQGRVGFTSSREGGTRFELWVPIRPALAMPELGGEPAKA